MAAVPLSNGVVVTKIAFIGAGSTVFAQKLLADIIRFPELADATVALHDIDDERLRTSDIVSRKIARQLGASPTIEATTDRRQALDGADFVMSMFQVGGYRPATVTDFEIPKKYGLRQTIGDTLGIGGIMRSLRTIPVLLDLCRDMEEICPDATFLNYVNPMAMNCWAIDRASSIRTIGLCHSVPHTAHHLAGDIGVPADEVSYLVAGINHVAFFLKFERDGEDLYPRLREFVESGKVAPRNYMPWPLTDQVRYEVFRRLGYFVTESSEHFSEFVPWFIKRDRPDLIERFNIPLDEYPRRCEWRIEGWEKLRSELESSDEPIELDTQEDYGPLIVHSMVTGQPRTVYGNVPNHGLIDNLPDGCCVEVPCLVDANGVQPTYVGALPPQLAALMQTNINAQALTVEAALTGEREHIYHAAMMDPHTSAELDLDQIWAMVDELIDAHGDLLPPFDDAARGSVSASLA
jgi:alpha-galactosidase